MARVGKILHKTLIWSYERGSLQYDIICGLILAFIFFMPRACFVKPKPDAQKSIVQATTFSSGDAGQSIAPSGPKR